MEKNPETKKTRKKKKKARNVEIIDLRKEDTKKEGRKAKFSKTMKPRQKIPKIDLSEDEEEKKPPISKKPSQAML